MRTSESKGGRPARNGEKPFTEIFRQLIQGETQQTAADKIGVSRQNIGKWLSGSTTPDIETLCRIADAYNVPADYLLGRTPNKTTDAELQAVCDYTGLSEKAIENIKQIPAETELDLLNVLCETEEITKTIEVIAKYALCRCAMLSAASVYKKSQQLNLDTSEYEKQIKEYRQSAEHLKTAASLQIDKMLAISTINLSQTLLKLTEAECDELSDFANSFSKVKGLSLSLEDLLNDIEENKGADENG